MWGTTLEGQSAIDYHEAADPLLYRQRALLDILNAEQRQQHIDMKNAKKHAAMFTPGDIVSLQKQIFSDTLQGISAILLFKIKSPYRVLEQVTPTSYNVQKLRFLHGLSPSHRTTHDQT
jgi:hypothetical protein